MAINNKTAKNKPDHICDKERELGELSTLLNRISHEVFNNGEGLAKSVPRMETKINDLAGAVTSHTKIIANFIEFQASHNGVEKGKKEEAERAIIAEELKARLKKEVEDRDLVIANLKAKKINDHWQRVIWILMAVIAVASIWTAIYINNKSIIQQVQRKEGVSKTTRSGYVKYIDQGFIDSTKVRQAYSILNDTIK